MTISKLVKILEQAEKNGEGEQEIMVEVMGKDNLKREYGFDMYHCARDLEHLHYNVCPLIPFKSN